MSEKPNKLTKDQAAVIGAYTGFLCGPLEDVHKLIEDLLDRPIFTHELASRSVWKDVRERLKPQFIELSAEGDQACLHHKEQLTDAQLDKIIIEQWGEHAILPAHRAFARAIERAHNISRGACK